MFHNFPNFRMKKIISLAALGLLVAQSCFADVNIADLKAASNESLLKLQNAYEAKINALQGEVTALRSELAKYQSGATSSIKPSTTTAVATITPVPTVTTASGTTIVSTGSTGNAKYDTIITKVNKEFPFILSANNFSASGSLGLFEFIEPNAFFLSIDDGKNPAGVTAFKNKILYQYTTTGALVFTTVGVFDLDYTSQKYVTKYGKNPYAGATRIRIKNPNYKGKLLDEATPTTVTSGSSTSTTTSTTSSVSSVTNPTIKDIQAYYDKNKFANVISLANTYLAKNPTDADALRMRALSLYFTSNPAEGLKDMNTLYAAQGSSLSCTNARDGWTIAKAASDATASTKFMNYYNSKCKK